MTDVRESNETNPASAFIDSCRRLHLHDRGTRLGRPPRLRRCGLPTHSGFRHDQIHQKYRTPCRAGPIAIAFLHPALLSSDNTHRSAWIQDTQNKSKARTSACSQPHSARHFGCGAASGAWPRGRLTRDVYNIKRKTKMPEISRFLGIIITMYFDEHDPPHFHVRYNDYRASVDIRTLNITVGSLPAKVRGLVQEWAELHKDELLDMWNSKDFHKIDPLV